MNNVQITKLLLEIASNYLIIGSNVKIKYVKDRPGHDFRYALDSKKIRNKLNWKPDTSFKSGLNKTFLWYLNNKKYFTNLKEKNISKRLGIFK